jgi:hypothetical protein
MEGFVYDRHDRQVGNMESALAFLVALISGVHLATAMLPRSEWCPSPFLCNLKRSCIT